MSAALRDALDAVRPLKFDVIEASDGYQGIFGKGDDARALGRFITLCAKELPALLAKSAAYEALVAEIAKAPVGHVDIGGCDCTNGDMAEIVGDIETLRALNYKRVRLLVSDDHPSHTLREMGMDELNCLNRCRRLHPHCTLKIARSAAPDHFWRWIVTMPDGHAFDFKGGFDFDGALLSMRTEGVDSLKKADELWRTRDKRQTPETGASQ